MQTSIDPKHTTASPAALAKHGPIAEWVFVESLAMDMSDRGFELTELWKDAYGATFEVVYLGPGKVDAVKCPDADGIRLGAAGFIPPKETTRLATKLAQISVAARAKHGAPELWHFVEVLSIGCNEYGLQNAETWRDAQGELFELRYLGAGFYVACLDTDGADAIDQLYRVPDDCQNCGACCFSKRVNGKYVEVTPADFDRMDERTQRMVVETEGKRFMSMDGLKCVALAADPVTHRFGCSIYEMRPEVCRVFTRASDRCQIHILDKRHLPIIRAAIGLE